MGTLGAAMGEENFVYSDSCGLSSVEELVHHMKKEDLADRSDRMNVSGLSLHETKVWSSRMDVWVGWVD